MKILSAVETRPRVVNEAVRKLQELNSDTAWAAYTPVVSASTGTITTSSATGRSKTIGKTTYIEMVLTITDNGTGAAAVIATLPNTSASEAILSGRGRAVSGASVHGAIGVAATAVVIFRYDNAYPGATGEVLVLSGVYENA